MVRYAKESDAHAIFRLLCQLEATAFDEDAFTIIYHEDLKKSAHACFVYEVSGDVIGFLHVRCETQWHHMAKMMEVMELIVDEQQRSLGVGAKLMEAATQKAQQENCQYIELTTNKKRIRAHHFYEAQGFVQTSFKYVKKIR